MGWHSSIHSKFVGWVGKTVRHLINESKAADELVRGNGLDVGMALVVKFNSKMMLKDVGVWAAVESWA
jgi:hypothetical protein